VEFRVKLSRDTGVNLTAAACEELLWATFRPQQGSSTSVSLQSKPGLFYANLGREIAAQGLDERLEQYGNQRIPDHLKVAWWCFREAAEVHKDPRGMRALGGCLCSGRGVTEDPAQALVWFQKASDLGDAPSKANVGKMLSEGDARAGVAKDAARGLQLFCEAVEEGHRAALFQVAECYLKGDGVEKDAVHGVSLWRQAVEQEDVMQSRAMTALGTCYMTGDGVEEDTVQATLWCQRAAKGGDPAAALALPLIRMCRFCGKTPARQLCARCEKVRDCDHQCQLAHWDRAFNPHKGHCRRLVPRRAADEDEDEDEASDEDGA
jgi:TPR repeat protein